MASLKIVTLGPIFIPTSAGNLFGPPALTLSAGANNPPPATTWNAFYILRHVRVLNVDGANGVTISVYKDATGGSTAGKQVMWGSYVIPAAGYVEWFGAMRIAQSETDKFLVGIASGANDAVIQAEAELGIE